jgi:Flp pilus assembly pilin Flp
MLTKVVTPSKVLKNRRRRKGAALVEYALLLAGVALVALAAVAIFGHKTSDMIAATATVLPGAHADDNSPIVSGKLVETAPNADGNIALDVATILVNSDGTKSRLGDNILGAGSGDGFGGLVAEP